MELESERVSPTGNIAPAGILNQLGRPTMDSLAVLVREAVQNTWDARLSDDISVLFRLDGWILNAAQRKVLMEEIFEECPSQDSLPLASCLHSLENITVLAVSDRGTTGLGGPTRADVVTLPGEARDFVDFLRNVGQPPQKRFAGGTYGYGKAIFYRISSVRTLCVYTRCMTLDGPESRFTVAALGEAFTSGNARYTGRHWWGEDRNGVVEPILNLKADYLAASIGLSTFAEDELGTTIVIIQPIFTQEVAEELQTPNWAYRKMAEYLLWYCWPKMLGNGQTEPSMRFAVSWQGEDIEIPDPTVHPPLQGFVQAMRRLKGPELPNSSLQHMVKDIASQRPIKHLGRLALQQVLLAPNNTVGINSLSSLQFTQLTHHTALMRQPELIVNYVSGPAPASPYVGYAGVFLVDSAVDDVFAASEPPTHDAWVKESLEERSERIYVNVALKSIDREMVAFVHPPKAPSSATRLTPLGAFASMIGDSLSPSVPGPTARPGLPSREQHLDTLTLDETGKSSQSDAAKNAETSGSNNALLGKDASQQSQGGNPGSPHKQANGRDGSSDSTASPKSTTSPRLGRASVRSLSDGDFVIVDGVPALEIPLEVTHAPQSQGTIVQVEISAILDGGQRETEPPIGGSRSEVLQWTAPDGSHFKGAGIFIPIQIQGTWHVLISVPADIVLSVELRATARI